MKNSKKIKTTTKTSSKKKSPKSTKITKTYVAFVLDKSGSMASVQDATISTFNEQIEKIERDSADIKTNVSLITFNDRVDVVYLNESVKKLEKLTTKTYAPNGMTAMYDAVGDTLDKLEAVKDSKKENVAFLVLVVSDGAENSSKRHTQSNIAERIQKLQQTKRWTFTYLGANQDLSDISAKLNIPIMNTASFVASNAGLKTASVMTRSAIGNYYSKLQTADVSATCDFYGTETTKPDDDKNTQTTITSPKSPITLK